MTFCLYECLRAVGLQHHYARFTSVGISRAAHISELTMEDYPNLGIRSMEDRTRLFHLVQMVKTLDLESLECGGGDDDDDENIADGDDEGFAVADRSFVYDGWEDPDEDVYGEDEKGAAVSQINGKSFSKPSSVRRRLDFSCETTDNHQKLCSRPAGIVHVNAVHRNKEPDRASVVPVQRELDTGCTVVCSSRGNHNQRLDVDSQPDFHRGANTGIKEGISICDFDNGLSPKSLSFHKPKSRPATATSKRLSNKPVGHKSRKGISKKEKLRTEINSNRDSEHLAEPTPIYESKRTAGYNYGLPLSSPPPPNKRQPWGQRISVCVRKRPLTRTECRRGEADVVTTPSGECVIVHESREAVDLTQYILQHKFYFDQVFGEESTNEEVYRRTAYPLVQHMLNGGKGTCFAYGQTGAGKTHTMLGSSPGTPGLYTLAVQDIFAHLSTSHKHSPLQVYVSFFEIYCGQLYDLLDHKKRLFAREDGQRVVHIAGLRHVRVCSVNSLLEVVSLGTDERTQGVSGVNPLSSRSHALLQIQLRGPNQKTAGRMWFVDLAGSERAADTKEPDRQSRMEGAEINQSLLALKECIRSLDQEQAHTPFRQSKLTQVLKDSFVGDSMTCMIANISPGHLATEHTLNTLRYADRVKELRGHGGVRVGRREKTVPSPKRILSNSNGSSGGSSVGTRGKSPPKKPKLGRQREAFGPTGHSLKLATGGAVLCSTPKNSRWEEDTSTGAGKGIGLEQITPVRGLLGNKRERTERAGETEGRRGDHHDGNDSAGHSGGQQNIQAGLVLGQEADEQLHSLELQRGSGFYQREMENQQKILKGRREGEGREEKESQVDCSRNTYNEVERLKQRDLHETDRRDNERVRHLRWYHQQLQQFRPSCASSPPSCPSSSVSNQASLSSSVSPLSSSLRHSSHLSESALLCHGLEEVSDVYRAKVEVRVDGNRGQLAFFPGGEIYSQTESSLINNENKDDFGHNDLSGVDENWRVAWDGTGAGFGQDSAEIEKRRLMMATSEAEVRVRQEDRMSAGMDAGTDRRWAWVGTSETKQADKITGGVSADVEAAAPYNCDSEEGEDRLDATHVPADGMRSTEEREGACDYSLLSTHSDSFFNCPPVASPRQRAPAERPLSPSCEPSNTLVTPNKLGDRSLNLKHTRHTSNILHLPLQAAKQGVPSIRHSEKEPWLTASVCRKEFSNAQSATLPLNTSIVKEGCTTTEPLNMLSAKPADSQVHNHLKKAKTSVLLQEETFTDSLRYTTDPLSVSLLEVRRELATTSSLRGDQSNNSLRLLVKERGKGHRRDVQSEHLKYAEVTGKVAKAQDVECHFSSFELPQTMIHYPSSSHKKTATHHTEREKDRCCVTDGHCGTGMTMPPITEEIGSFQHQENNQKSQTTTTIKVLGSKDPAPPLKPLTCVSVQASVTQPISSSAKHSGNTGPHPAHNLNASQMPPEYAQNSHNISALQSESVFGQLNTLPNSPKELNSHESPRNQQIRPRIHLNMLDDLDHDQWRVVQAHWEQLEEMEALSRKEGTLLCRQPDMAFREYVHKLEEIMDRKARCVQSMIAQLKPYLKPRPSDQPHNQREDDPVS